MQSAALSRLFSIFTREKEQIYVFFFLSGFDHLQSRMITDCQERVFIGLSTIANLSSFWVGCDSVMKLLCTHLLS